MSRVVLYPSGIKRMASRQGPVGKIIDHKARLIENAARRNIQNNLTRDRADRTGDLEASLRKVPIEDSSGYHVAVGADAQHRGFKYARALETGINPDTGDPLNFLEGSNKAYMVPAVITAGFRLRSKA